MNSDTKFQFHLNDISGSSYYNSLWPKAMVPSQGDFATMPTQALAFSGHLPMSCRHLGLLKLGGGALLPSSGMLLNITEILA